MGEAGRLGVPPGDLARCHAAAGALADEARAIVPPALLHGILGEEYPSSHTDSAFQWIMDAIDGTEDLVQAHERRSG